MAKVGLILEDDESGEKISIAIYEGDGKWDENSLTNAEFIILDLVEHVKKMYEEPEEDVVYH